MDYFNKNEIKAGALIVVCTAILALFIFKIGDFQIFKSTHNIKAGFSVAQGLETQSSVMYAGVPVGKITEIKILTDKEISQKVESLPENTPQDRIDLIRETRVIFTASVEKTAMLKIDSKAAVKTMGLMGEKYIELSPGSPASPLLGESDILYGEEPFDMQELLVGGKQIIEKIDKMLDNLSDFLGDEEMIASLKSTVKNFEGMAVNAHEMVVENKEGVRSIVKNLAQATDGLRGKLDNTVSKLDGLLTNADGMIGDNREDVREMVKKFRSASEYFAQFAEKIEANPWMLLKKDPR